MVGRQWAGRRCQGEDGAGEGREGDRGAQFSDHIKTLAFTPSEIGGHCSGLP